MVESLQEYEEGHSDDSVRLCGDDVHRSSCWFFISSSRTLWPSRQSIHLCLCPTTFFILSGSGSVKFPRCNYLLRGQSYARLCDVLSLTSSSAAESLILVQHNLEFNVDVMLVTETPESSGLTRESVVLIRKSVGVTRHRSGHLCSGEIRGISRTDHLG